MTKKKDPAICLCNKIKQSTIEAAIQRGCHKLPLIYDATQAGAGPCGGSCRPVLQHMLDEYLAKGEFPEKPRKILARKD